MFNLVKEILTKWRKRKLLKVLDARQSALDTILALLNSIIEDGSSVGNRVLSVSYSSRGEYLITLSDGYFIVVSKRPMDLLIDYLAIVYHNDVVVQVYHDHNLQLLNMSEWDKHAMERPLNKIQVLYDFLESCIAEVQTENF